MKSWIWEWQGRVCNLDRIVTSVARADNISTPIILLLPDLWSVEIISVTWHRMFSDQSPGSDDICWMQDITALLFNFSISPEPIELSELWCWVIMWGECLICCSMINYLLMGSHTETPIATNDQLTLYGSNQDPAQPCFITAPPPLVCVQVWSKLWIEPLSRIYLLLSSVTTSARPCSHFTDQLRIATARESNPGIQDMEISVGNWDLWS